MVLDRLSRESIYLSNTAHKYLLNKFYTSHMPSNLKIRQLPRNITSFYSLILHIYPIKKQRFVKPKLIKLLHGDSGII